MILTAQNTSLFTYWGTLDKIPDTVGFAGSFAGVSNQALIVAGGANFPGKGAPWLGTKKVWYDDIFVLKDPAGKWERAGRLPQPLGYGVSISSKEGLIIIGGSNASGHFSDVYNLKYKQGSVTVASLPSLPVTLANSCGTLAGDCIYVLGGLVGPDDPETKRLFLCLDLKDLKKGWIELPELPGPSRMLAVAAAVDQTFFVFSGTTLEQGKRNYLRDAYCYNKTDGWKRLEDMPAATVAAPSPAYSDRNGIYVFGGDDGSLAGSDLRDRHPGFSRDILQFSLKTQQWEVIGKIPVAIRSDAVEAPNESRWAPVTTTLAVWNNALIIPGGEVRPGTRTPNVLTVKLKARKQDRE
ncbi:galactose oxidase [Niabella beijingensis]|uniref:galactose oxidase n=1 Tax=Niabella beijingensis TaxID=2872700 RepID=UPI001CBD75FF|nr:galactose oxidase [Niabella beijingensis]MBZ4192457.1 galactose oxidase [Niabella beijingensis]